MERVIAYVDGFNLYFGLKSKGWKRYYWLNVKELASRLLRPNQMLVGTKYFTARINGPQGKRKRQSTFIEALQTLSELEIMEGKYQLNRRLCRSCGFQDSVPSEKMTDVNIAVKLLEDAVLDSFDTALLISADADLTPAVNSLVKLFPAKRVVIAFPPDRYSAELAKSASAFFHIGRAPIAKSQSPLTVAKADGFMLFCPVEWRSAQSVPTM
ncbi:MAG: NYN domain-containing protein [Chloroflexi bacterium]|nr:NYN domain-containing protein [Chloroflexota bacterium]MDA8186731.1 NYN domain-containing protein [Dehalococcoidales bacterium]